ncbi:hypothetical protein BDR06DRAFT_957807 [Suillus hirtellus]|nr:hypothetical protein BDR06DRAFT_957807 [Suillus hirtellus]
MRIFEVFWSRQASEIPSWNIDDKDMGHGHGVSLKRGRNPTDGNFFSVLHTK